MQIKRGIMGNIKGRFQKLQKYLSCCRGQTLVEYALLLVLIAIVLVAVVTITGGKLTNKYSTIVSTVP